MNRYPRPTSPGELYLAALLLLGVVVACLTLLFHTTQHTPMPILLSLGSLAAVAFVLALDIVFFDRPRH